MRRSIIDLWGELSFSLTFLFFEFLLISVWLSIRKRQFVNVVNGFLGWGDILFLISISFYLSFLDFFFFNLASILSLTIGWGVLYYITKGKYRHVPLAGMQAILLVFFLGINWWYYNQAVAAEDYNILHFLVKWI